MEPDGRCPHAIRVDRRRSAPAPRSGAVGDGGSRGLLQLDRHLSPLQPASRPRPGRIPDRAGRLPGAGPARPRRAARGAGGQRSRRHRPLRLARCRPVGWRPCQRSAPGRAPGRAADGAHHRAAVPHAEEGPRMRRYAFAALWITLFVQVGWMVLDHLATHAWYLVVLVAGSAALAVTLGRRPWITVALRVLLGLDFLGSVADRFGLLGPPGAAGVSWGDFGHFVIYTH